MSRLLLICVVIGLFFSCKKKEKFVVREVVTVDIETILQDSLLNVRALELTDKAMFIATSEGETMMKKINSSNVDTIYKSDANNKTNFRAIAHNGTSVFTLSIGNPGLLYKDGQLVYKEIHEKVFYDSMTFWNEKEGIAIGDTTDDCLSVIITRDAGETWQKLPCNILPKGKVGAFAASDTNIKVIGNHTWAATGGKSSSVLYSSDKGKSWQVFETPIVQGKETTGIYSLDFYDENIGFAIGGDYMLPEDNKKNKIRTTDGGKTWNLISAAKGPGYRSCVQFVPNRKGKELVAVGFKGVDYSNNFGESWKHLSDKGFYTIRFLNDSIAYAGGNGSVAKLTFKNK